LVGGPEDTVLEVNGRRFATNDDGAPMMCNLYCADLGRHVHVDYCRSGDSASCGGAEVQHIPTNVLPNPKRAKDWITHGLYWRRMGTSSKVSSFILPLTHPQGSKVCRRG